MVEPFKPGTGDENLEWIIRKIDWPQVEDWMKAPKSITITSCPMCGLPAPPDTIDPPTHNICPLCSWEDDGEESEIKYSGANANLFQTRNRAERIVKSVRKLARMRILGIEFRRRAVPADE